MSRTCGRCRTLRLIGNAGLSFLTKLSSGYWNVFDPTNGYTAISAPVLSDVPLGELRRRYFFKSDLLFRLGTIQACVLDSPMTAVYAGEASGLQIGRVFLHFFVGNIGNFGKRVFYGYFLRGFSIASLELMAELALFLFGVLFGVHGWAESAATHAPRHDGHGNARRVAGHLGGAIASVVPGLRHRGDAEPGREPDTAAQATRSRAAGGVAVGRGDAFRQFITTANKRPPPHRPGSLSSNLEPLKGLL